MALHNSDLSCQASRKTVWGYKKAYSSDSDWFCLKKMRVLANSSCLNKVECYKRYMRTNF